MVRKFYGVNLATWRMFMNTILRAAVHLRKGYDMNFEICEELSLENNGTAFQRIRKADQWSDRNYWHKPDQFPRYGVGIDTLAAQSSLSIFHGQSLRLLRFCTLGKTGDDPVESWKSQIQWYSDNNYFKDLNRIDGQPMELE